MQTLAFMQHMQGINSADIVRSGSDTGMGKSKSPSSFEPAMRNATNRNKVSAPAKENQHRGRTEDLAGAAVASSGASSDRDVADKAVNGAASNGKVSSPSSSVQGQDTAQSQDPAQTSRSEVGQVATSVGDQPGTPVDGTQFKKSLYVALQAVERNALNSEAGEQLQSSLRNTLQLLEQGEAILGETLATQTQGSEGLQELQNLPSMDKHGDALQGESFAAQVKNSVRPERLQQFLQLLEQGGTAQNKSPQGDTLASQLQSRVGVEGLQELQEMLAVALGNAPESAAATTRIDVAPMHLSQEGKIALVQVQALLEQVMRQGENGANVNSDWRAHVSQPEVVEGFVLHSNDAKSSKTAGKVDDPRFAELLNKPVDYSSLREQQKSQDGKGADALIFEFLPPQTQTPSPQGQTGINFGVENTETQSAATNFAAAPTLSSVGSGTEGLAEVSNPDFSANVKAEGAHGNSTAPSDDPSIITLKNGTTVPMARVVDQTIQHLNLHSRGDSSVVTVRLHPEELGELNIRMVMEGDKLKLQIQAQNQQVREVLEQNFPRLRTAMEDQGVTVEDFQVSLGSNGAEDQAHSQSDDAFTQRGRTASGGLLAECEADAVDIAAPQRAVTAGGLSVHV
ncbi:MAG: flagellar hook-length control protein FliK [Desulfuromonadaceae bacterium]|nr:flagellar hook-length control protein FliK [Desulfuromonas sp.]MDY0184993.1 flagellar hook-length control protein FliK [Desulfuromonadaceae bacterium]